MWEVEKEFDEVRESTDGWKPLTESKKKGEEMKCETRMSKRGINTIRVETRSDFDTIRTARAYLDGATKVEMDKNIKDVECTQIVACNLYECWQITNAVLAVASRDVYQYYWIDIKSDNSIKIVSFDIEDRPLAKSGKVVRMKIPMAGVLFIPDPEDSSKTILKCVIEGDMNGSIPNWVKSEGLKGTAQGLQKLRKLIPKYIKKNEALANAPIIEQ